MNFPACPDAFAAFYPAGCYESMPSQPSQLPSLTSTTTITWHMVPLSPTATGLVLVLLSILLTTLLVSKPQK